MPIGRKDLGLPPLEVPLPADPPSIYDQLSDIETHLRAITEAVGDMMIATMEDEKEPIAVIETGVSLIQAIIDESRSR